jgi:Right handed beta helix region
MPVTYFLFLYLARPATRRSITCDRLARRRAMNRCSRFAPVALGCVLLSACFAELDLDSASQQNDTRTIQDIINANRGGTARLPLGTYVVSGLTVPENTRVTTQYGPTRIGTTLKLLPDVGTGVTTPILFIQGSGVTIDTLTFDGDVDNQEPEGSYANSFTGRSDSAAIRIDPGPDLETILIENCLFQNTRGAAIATKRDLVGLTVRDNDFHALNFEGVFLDAGPDGSSNITITNNEVLDTRDIVTQQMPPPDGFFGGDGFVVKGVSGLTFTGNTGRNIPKNLVKATNVSNGIISNNVMQTTRLVFAGIQLDTLITNVEVSNNLLHDVYTSIAVNCSAGTSGITITNNTIRDTLPHGNSFGIKVTDATDGTVTISHNTLTNVEGDAIRIATGANGVVVEDNIVIRGTASQYTAQALRFDISDDVALASLRVTGNCFLDYDGTGTSLNVNNPKGAVWINNGAAGGSGVLINNNIVQSSSRRRSIYVGTNTANNVNGTIGSNQFLGTTPFSEAPGMFISWSNVPIQVRYTACP